MVVGSSSIGGHIPQELVDLREVVAFVRGRGLDEAFPGVRVGEAGGAQAVEDVVLGLDRGDQGALQGGAD